MNPNQIVKNILGDKHSRDKRAPILKEADGRHLHLLIGKKKSNIIECEDCQGDGLDENMRTCKKCNGAGSYVDNASISRG
jgi:RecJ-like exonuclease